MDPAKIQLLAAWAIPILFAITLHEVAHGWVARYFGDDTAARLGRLSLNPIKHVDLVGTVLVPTVMWLFSGFLFGWAKPVPVIASRLRHPRQHMAIVAAAGPLVNLAMAILWAGVFKLALLAGGQGVALQFLTLMAIGGIAINLVLMVLNLLPIPPLDGSRVLNGFLPEPYARQVDRLEQYGLIIVIALLVTGTLGRVMGPLLGYAKSLVLGLFGLPDLGIF
ncbi:MAG: site-2 protease family protein [Nevskiales bacterium]